MVQLPFSFQEPKRAEWFGALDMKGVAQFGSENPSRNAWRPEKGT